MLDTDLFPPSPPLWESSSLPLGPPFHPYLDSCSASFLCLSCLCYICPGSWISYICLWTGISCICRGSLTASCPGCDPGISCPCYEISSCPGSWKTSHLDLGSDSWCVKYKYNKCFHILFKNFPGKSSILTYWHLPNWFSIIDQINIHLLFFFSSTCPAEGFSWNSKDYFRS